MSTPGSSSSSSLTSKKFDNALRILDDLKELLEESKRQIRILQHHAHKDGEDDEDAGQREFDDDILDMRRHRRRGVGDEGEPVGDDRDMDTFREPRAARHRREEAEQQARLQEQRVQQERRVQQTLQDTQRVSDIALLRSQGLHRPMMIMVTGMHRLELRDLVKEAQHASSSSSIPLPVLNQLVKDWVQAKCRMPLTLLGLGKGRDGALQWMMVAREGDMPEKDDRFKAEASPRVKAYLGNASNAKRMFRFFRGLCYDQGEDAAVCTWDDLFKLTVETVETWPLPARKSPPMDWNVVDEAGHVRVSIKKQRSRSPFEDESPERRRRPVVMPL